MPALTRSAPSDVTRIGNLGPIKMEIVEFEPASGAGVIQGDTIETRLTNPKYGFAFPNGDNAGTFSVTLTATADSKTLTVNVADGTLDNDLTLVFVIFGF